MTTSSRRCRTTWRRLASPLLLLLPFVACDDNLVEIQTAQLVVNPASLIFAQSPTGSNYTEGTLEVRNAGDATLVIENVIIEEDDDITELILLDADDWASGSKQLAPGASELLVVGWRVLDAQLDTGIIHITSNGGDLAVPVVTPDVDPELEVTSVPPGERKPRGLRVTLTDVLAGNRQAIPITLRSAAAAPLTIDTICLVGAAGGCAEGQTSTEGAFTLCAGRAPDPTDCAPPAGTDPLLYDATHTFTVYYHPPLDTTDTVAANILIRSNAAAAPDFIVTLEGTPCVRRADGDVCGTCGDLTVDGDDTCDDGNVDDSDACLSNCRMARCGDGIRHLGAETCDGGAANSDTTPDACRTSCEPADCGDGAVDTDEECDAGDANSDTAPDTCRTDCTTPRCGDGATDTDEECDDGEANSNTVPGACQTDCTIPPCGNGVPDPGEECDNGRANSDTLMDACRTDCTNPRCGDGIMDTGEDCDDPASPMCLCRPDCTFPIIHEANLTINTPQDLAAVANVNTLVGNLVINNYTEATFDWSGLDCIQGSLTVEGINVRTLLENLDGLSGVRTLEGDLRIQNNRALTSAAGLSNLSAVHGQVIIDNNVALTTLQSFQFLSGTIPGNLSITSNDALTSLTGLQNITAIEGNLLIQGPMLIGDLGGLSGLTRLDGDLQISSLDQLASLDGLELLTALHGVNIFDNLRLVSLTGIGGVVGVVMGDLRLFNNSALDSLDGLYGITGVTGALTIRMNRVLPECEALRWAEAFATAPSSTIIMGNDTAAVCQ